MLYKLLNIVHVQIVHVQYLWVFRAYSKSSLKSKKHDQIQRTYQF